MRLIWLALITALLAGCGAGGGAAGNAVEPGAVIIDLDTRAGSAATVIYAVELTLHLPAGVTLPVEPVSEMVSKEALQPVIPDSAWAFYLPVPTGARALVKVNIAVPGGFTVGHLATLTCAVAPGTAVNWSGFLPDDEFSAWTVSENNTVKITGVTAHFTVRTP